MKLLLYLIIQLAVYLGVNMQYIKGSTYNTSCVSSDDCFGFEECLEDPICNQSTCQCDSAHFYNKTLNTCEEKKKYQMEECDNCDQCSTWFSVCDTVASRVKSVCTCPSGYFYHRDTDSCTNIEQCPEDSSYIFFRDENVCYKVETDCVGCKSWEHFCKENSSVPLKFLGNLKQHLIDRLWTYGIYSYQHLSDEVQTLILSTVHNNPGEGEELLWYWPGGGVITIDDEIDFTNWTKANAEGEACLYMLNDACQPVLRAARPCRLQNAYRGCLIQLPTAYCNKHTDERDTVWEFAEGGTVVTKSCPAGYSGEVTRACATNGEFKVPFYNCTLEIFKNITEKLENGNVSAPEALAEVASSIKDTDDLFIGDLLEVQNILHKIVNLVDETVNTTLSENSTNDFIETASFLLDNEKNGKEWESRMEHEGKGAEEFLNVVETFVKLAADSLLGSNKSSLSLAKKNIVFEYAEIDTKNTAPQPISFPTVNRQSPDWNSTLTSSLLLDTSSFKSEGVKAFTSLLYRNLSKSVPQTLEGKSKDVKVDINSQVISFVLLPKSPDILNPELVLQFHGFQDMESTEQHCSFWKTDVSDKSFWSTKGCRKVTGNSTVATCKCNHLTNFALLVSTYVPPEKDVRILGILTYIGCSISMFFICITLGAHIKYWRLMKSDKAILLVCLCVTFLVCYALFLAGVTETSNESVCTGIAVTLHYVFLVLFFLMLAEGVSVFITVTFPFHKKSHLTELLCGAFLLPLIITGVSAGVTKLDGYGNENSCWLTPGTGLFWTFAGPAAVVILANFITIGLFFRRLYGTKATASKSVKEKAEMTAIAVGVLTPVMGLTWIFGIFSVNKETLWLQYVFCIFNIFQGVFVFAFHCYGNKQLRRVIRASRERKKSVKGFTSELKEKIKHRFDTHHTDITETSASAMSNDKSAVEKDIADQFSTTDADIKSVPVNVEPWDSNNEEDECSSNPAKYINPVYQGESLQLGQNAVSLTFNHCDQVSKEEDTADNNSVYTEEKADDKAVYSSDRICEKAEDISVDSTGCTKKRGGDSVVNSSNTLDEKEGENVINGADNIADYSSDHTDETAGNIAVNGKNQTTEKPDGITIDSSNNTDGKSGDIDVNGSNNTDKKSGDITVNGSNKTDEKSGDIGVNGSNNTDDKLGDITVYGSNNTDEKSGDIDVSGSVNTDEKSGDITVNGSNNTDDKSGDIDVNGSKNTDYTVNGSNYADENSGDITFNGANNIDEKSGDITVTGRK